MQATFKNPRQRKLWIWALILSVIAVYLNWLCLELFLGFELLLGSSLGVLALLLLGDIGLLVGISASLVTWKIWGYPWCALTVMLELLWLRSYLQFFGNTDNNNVNGRIILADALYWIAVGIPMVFLFFGLAINLDPGSMLQLAIKQSLNGVIGTTIGFSLFLVLRIAQTVNNRSKAIPIHGLVMALMMVSIIAPSMTILTVVSNQLVQATEQGKSDHLQMIAKVVATAAENELQNLSDFLHASGENVEFERLKPATPTQRFQSNPGLFKTLSQNHSLSDENIVSLRGLELLVMVRPPLHANHFVNSYWRFDLTRASIDQESYISPTNGDFHVVVVEPAWELMQKLQQQTTQNISILAWSLLFAILISEMLAQELSRQFSLSYLRITEAERSDESPGTRAQQEGKSSILTPLKTGFIADLNAILDLLNQRTKLITGLQDELQNTTIRLKTSREEVGMLNTMDPLTGCYNRPELYRRLDFELQRSNRNHSKLSCLCLEVDHYNQITKSYGQPMAEKILIELVADLQVRSRATDCLCRSGEAEFSLLLPSCSVESAEMLAKKFLAAVEARVITLGDQQIKVTISIGISCSRPENDDSESLINRTENALYRAKLEGRNRIVTI